MSATPLLLGVDVGTTSAKALLADAEGGVLAEHIAGYDIVTPRPLWAEQWPQVWLDGLAQAVRGVLRHAEGAADEVVGMAVSSLYGGSGIPVDRLPERLVASTGGGRPPSPVRGCEAGRAAGYPLDDVLHVVGGGARSALWLRIIAAVTGLPVVATQGGEAAYGDAMLAAVGVGLADRSSLERWAPSEGRERLVEPDVEDRAVYDVVYPHFVGLYEDLKDRFAALAATD